MCDGKVLNGNRVTPEASCVTGQKGGERVARGMKSVWLMVFICLVLVSGTQATKLAGEFYLNYYREVHGMEYVALRYGNVFGPRQDPHGEAGVVAIFSNRLQAGTSLSVFGDGEQTRDYVFVRDIVGANMTVSEMELPAASGGLSGEPGEPTGLDAVAFNVGTGQGTSVNRLADILEEVSGNHPDRKYEEARPGELRHSTLDARRLQARGWSCKWTLEEGLRETYEHIAKKRETA